jgi:hypothetical protein
VVRVRSASAARALRLGLALAITLPLLLVVGGLLASADPVFAGLFSPDIDLVPTTGHIVLSLIAASGVVSVVVTARGDSDSTLPPDASGRSRSSPCSASPPRSWRCSPWRSWWR